MDFQQAVEELTFHCGTNPNTDDPRWSNGFLSMLRPYAGLRRETYEHLLSCVAAVQEYTKNDRMLDRRVINALWGICHFARAWGLHPDGMLRQNNPITQEDRVLLKGWIEDLSYRVAMWLDGNDA